MQDLQSLNSVGDEAETTSSNPTNPLASKPTKALPLEHAPQRLANSSSSAISVLNPRHQRLFSAGVSVPVSSSSTVSTIKTVSAEENLIITKRLHEDDSLWRTHVEKRLKKCSALDWEAILLDHLL